MSFGDLFRDETFEVTVTGSPDHVAAWFIYEGANGRVRRAGDRLLLTALRDSGSTGFVRLRPGPWLDVRATQASPTTTRVSGRIGPVGTCWWWLFLSIIVPVPTVAVGVTLALVFPIIGLVLAPTFAVVMIAAAITNFVRASGQGRQSRAWAHEVADAALRELTTTAPR